MKQGVKKKMSNVVGILTRIVKRIFDGPVLKISLVGMLTENVFQRAVMLVEVFLSAWVFMLLFWESRAF